MIITVLKGCVKSQNYANNYYESNFEVTNCF